MDRLIARAMTLALLLTILAPANAAAERFFEGAARAQAFAEVARLRDLLEPHRDALLAIPGVVGTGIGLDRLSGRLVMRVMVEENSPMPALPAGIQGEPLMVVSQPSIAPQDTCNVAGAACHADQRILPIEMGNSGHTQPVAVTGGLLCHTCTVGFKACDLVTSDTVYVTAAHCSKGSASVCAGAAALGAPTYHRAPLDAPACTLEDTIGATSKQRAPVCGVNNTVDAASVISDAGQTQYAIRDIGVPSVTPGSVLPGDGVQKSGRTTGYTLGTVTDVAASVVVSGASAYCNCPAGIQFVDQIRIERAWSGVGFPSPPMTVWAKSGDSGSAVLSVNYEGDPFEIVGLNVLGDASGTFGYANPIDEVMAQLDLSLNPLDCVDLCAATEVADQTDSSRDTLRVTRLFRDHVLSTTDRGRQYTELYYRHTNAIVAIMREHPMLAIRTAVLYQRNLDLLEAVIEGRSQVIGTEQVGDIDALIARYQQRTNDPALRRDLGLIRSDLRDPAVLAEFGISLR